MSPWGFFVHTALGVSLCVPPQDNVCGKKKGRVEGYTPPVRALQTLESSGFLVWLVQTMSETWDMRSAHSVVFFPSPLMADGSAAEY